MITRDTHPRAAGLFWIGLLLAAAALALLLIIPVGADPAPSTNVPLASVLTGTKRDLLTLGAPAWAGPETSAAAPWPVLEPVGIYGRVMASGNALTNIRVALRRYDATTETSVMTTTTNATGDYLFTNVPTLPVGSTYYVRYGPNSTDPRYVSFWYGPDITAYAAGESRAGGDLDIANIPLDSPPHQAKRSFPIFFAWTKRNVPQDTYRFFIGDANQLWQSSFLGYVAQFILPSLPEGAAFNRVYRWYLGVYAASDSVGFSFHYREITFASQTATPTFTLTPTKTPTPTATFTPRPTPMPTNTYAIVPRIYLPLTLKGIAP